MIRSISFGVNIRGPRTKPHSLELERSAFLSVEATANSGCNIDGLAISILAADFEMYS